MNWGLVQTVAPTEEPVSVAELRDHLRVDPSDEDTLLQGLIKSARLHAETFTRRQLVTATWRLTLDGFPGAAPCTLFHNDAIHMPLPPLLTVTGITYVDSAGTTQTLSPSAYTVVTAFEPGRIIPAWSYVWPDTRYQAGAGNVNITFTCGYSTVALVPEGVKTAIKLLAAHLYEHRDDEAEAPMAIETLLMQHRYMGVA